MALAEKLTSARFFRPEELTELQMTADGELLDSPPRKNNVFRNVVGGFIVGLILMCASYYCVYQKGLVAHPNLQMQKLVSFVENTFLKR